MERIFSVNFCFWLLAVPLLTGTETVYGRNIWNQGNRLFRSNEESDTKNKMIALLLHKNVMPIENSEVNADLEMVQKVAELEELESLKEDLELQKNIDTNAIGMEVSFPSKRACFWKYCV
uniref:Urotensin 2 domain containing n=1 Tax=Lepisosteus oculatus TaxID=7918 RepID=W5MCG1_LEPOC|nr:PREDICTED: urotensin-2B [Lepisosteus oculatus]